MQHPDILPFERVALIFSQLTSSEEELSFFSAVDAARRTSNSSGEDKPIGDLIGDLSSWVFLKSFTSRWAPNRRRKYVREEFHLHFRYIDVIGPESPETLRSDMITAGGIKIERESGPFPTFNDNKKQFLVEKRTALKLVSKPYQDILLYSIIAIVDGDDTDVRDTTTGPPYAGAFSGLIVYLDVVTTSLRTLFRSWDRVIKALDEELKATVCLSLPKIHLTVTDYTN